MIFHFYNPFNETEITKKIWLNLLEKSPHSYFTSWGWVSTWLASLPKDLVEIQLIAGYIDNEPIIAFFMGRNIQKRFGILPTQVISLNETANRYYDILTVEYNSMLFDPSPSIDLDSLFHHLNSLDWDEFILSGVSADFVSTANLLDISSRHFHVLIDRNPNSHFVELQTIRDAGMDYLRLLSANKRSQVRRSIKEYEKESKIHIRQAADADEALLMLDQLACLHQQRWQNRGKPGAFSNEYFYQFHRDLIRNRFANGEIQLLHIFSDKMTIGYLYNFVYRRNVLFYQSGFNYSTGNNNHRPGLVAHYFAIMHNTEQNMVTYDFLAGDSDYKRSLATNSVPMYWVSLIKSQQRYIINMGFNKTKKTIKGLLKKMKVKY